MKSTPLVDVHVLIRPSSLVPSNLVTQYDLWRNESINSLNSPIIQNHIIDGTHTSNFLSVRKKGYSHGTSKYVCFVNDDDYVTGDPFIECVNELEKNSELSGVYTNSILLDHNKNTKTPFFRHKEWTRKFHMETPRPVHEISVIRRDVIFKAIDKIEQLSLCVEPNEATYLTTDAEQAIYSAVAAFGDWKFLSECLSFIWRKHNNGRHSDTYKSGQVVSSSRRQELRKLLMTV